MPTEVDESRLVAIEALINSMTPKRAIEKPGPPQSEPQEATDSSEDPAAPPRNSTNSSSQYKQMRKMMKKMKGSWMKGVIG